MSPVRWAAVLAFVVAIAVVGASVALGRDEPPDGAVTGAPAREGVLRVLPLGDSITYGKTELGGDSPGGYRGLLAERLAAEGITTSFVGTSIGNPPAGAADPAAYAHDGWPGARIDQIATALLGDSGLDGGHWLDGNQTRGALVPDVVVVHLGTNDIGQAWDPGTTYPGGYTATDPTEQRTFVTHLVTRLRALVNTIRVTRPDAAVVLCTIAPMRDYPTAAAFNDAVRDELMPDLEADGAHVVLADIEKAFLADPAANGPDGVHPTPHGYATMAEVIADAVLDLP